MRKQLTYILALATCFVLNNTTLLAQKNTKSKSVQKTIIDKGALFFERTFISIGPIEDKAEPVDVVFKYKNIGKGNVTISNIKTDCNCSQPTWDKKPIAFNQTGEFTIKFYTVGLSGNQTKKITVFCDGQPNVYYLSFSASVNDVNAKIAKTYPAKQGSMLFDSYEVKFPKITTGAPDSAQHAIFNPTKKHIKIFKVEAPKHITVIKSNDVILPNSAVGFKFIYNAKVANDYGLRLDEIIVHTDDSLVPVKKFLVRATIVEDFEKLTPKEKSNPPVFLAITPIVDLGVVNTQSTHTATFTITNKGKTPLYVRKISTSCGCATIDFDYSKPIKKGKKANIVVKFSTNYDLGMVEKQLTLITNTPAKTNHNLTLKANIVYTRQ
ncbi:MAG: DUF1573 domain-containing protein [Bacteroidia bacterium]|nr:DUF1573 domain-containing protein [Bacteroidia bacterium]